MALRLEFIFSLLVVTSLSSLLVSSSTGWWSLGLSSCANGGECKNCALLEEDGILSEEQTEKCTSDDGQRAMPAIAHGTRRAILECQHQFDYSKWNCTTFQGQDLFGSFVSEYRTRETAALFSYLTAGATQAVAEACREQKIPTCPCVAVPPTGNQDVTSGSVIYACSDNVPWATNFISEFLSSAIAGVGDMCDQWNINVGTKAISKTSEFCRCHGVSGSCAAKTCYEKASEINEVGEGLFIKYSGAVQVDLVNGSLQRTGPAAATADPLQPDDLCYVDDSPNFCNPDTAKGVLGTGDRLCDPDPSSSRSCSVLCCGRGHYPKTLTVPVEECRFVYCCRIECNVVRVDEVIEYRCNS